MRGTYTIIVYCSRERHRIFGRLGRAKLRRGSYLYTGSAMGSGSTSLERRLKRHEAHSKTVRWHIDYLTSMPECTVTGAVYVASNKRLECDVNLAISEKLKLHPVLPRIGASDCRCDGHLLGPELRLSRMALLELLAVIYRRLARGGSSRVVQIECASSHRF